MAEVLINLKSEDVSSRKLARYDFSKLNLPESITVEQVSEEIRAFQGELDHYLYEYERLIKRLETFVKIVEITGKGFNQKFDIGRFHYSNRNAGNVTISTFLKFIL